jgi:NitT/TauT family transport system permease protein
MPSIAWFPLAILLFKLSESAITFVVVIGAAPSIANGFVAGVDHVPPLLLRSGRMLGARGARLWRHVVVPAALPSLVGGLKQGWAFAWRSLMAGELLVIIAHRPSIGERLNDAQNLNDTVTLIEWMLVILVLGLAIDTLFGAADRSLRKRWGLLQSQP